MNRPGVMDSPVEWEWCDECQGEYGPGHRKMAHRTAGILRWRQRRLWGWLVGRMYVLGIISGSVASGHERGWIYHSLHWRGERPYIFGFQKHGWGRLPFWHRIRYGHWPETVWLGMCGVCGPWQCCGATGFDHADDCPEAWS